MTRLLTVCTGNICRSPFSERMLQKELDLLHPNLFSVSSAGTGAMVGDPMESESAGLLTDFGGSAEGFISRQISPAILADIDLVLTLTVEHRDAVIRMNPRMLKRTYTLVEFARILRTIRQDGSDQIIKGNAPEQVRRRWEELSTVAAVFRSRSKPSTAGDDVIDPYLASPEVHLQMVYEIMPAIEEILAFETWFSQ